MSYLELDLLPTKSEINPSDSFIVDSGALNTINSSSIDSTNFQNGFDFTGSVGPVDVKFYFHAVFYTVESTFSGITIGDGPDYVFLSRTDHLGIENKISISKKYAVALGSGPASIPLLSSGDDSLRYLYTVRDGISSAAAAPTTSFNGEASIELNWNNSTKFPSVGLFVR